MGLTRSELVYLEDEFASLGREDLARLAFRRRWNQTATLRLTPIEMPTVGRGGASQGGARRGLILSGTTFLAGRSTLLCRKHGFYRVDVGHSSHCPKCVGK
jgi:hypothetical protein